MAPRSPRTLTKRGQFWREHVERWERSDGTQIAYCREQGLSVGAFRWWRRHLRPGHPGRAGRRRRTSQPSAGFTEIQMPALAQPSPGYDYEIALPNQRQLRFQQHCEPEAVATLVALLERTC